MKTMIEYIMKKIQKLEEGHPDVADIPVVLLNKETMEIAKQDATFKGQIVIGFIRNLLRDNGYRLMNVVEGSDHITLTVRKEKANKTGYIFVVPNCISVLDDETKRGIFCWERTQREWSNLSNLPVNVKRVPMYRTHVDGVRFDVPSEVIQVWACDKNENRNNGMVGTNFSCHGFKDEDGAYHPYGFPGYLPLAIFSKKKEGDFVEFDYEDVHFRLELAQGKFRYRNHDNGRFEECAVAHLVEKKPGEEHSTPKYKVGDTFLFPFEYVNDSVPEEFAKIKTMTKNELEKSYKEYNRLWDMLNERWPDPDDLQITIIDEPKHLAGRCAIEYEERFGKGINAAA